MKYVVLIYTNPATWQSLAPAEAERVIRVHNDLIGELTTSLPEQRYLEARAARLEGDQ